MDMDVVYTAMYKYSHCTFSPPQVLRRAHGTPVTKGANRPHASAVRIVGRSVSLEATITSTEVRYS